MGIDLVSEIIDKINLHLDVETVLFYLNYRTNTLEQRGAVVKCFCPIHQDTIIRSLSIDPMKKTFRCKFTQCPGSRGGTLFELYQMATKKDKLETIYDLTARLQIECDKDALKKYTAMQEKEEHASISMAAMDLEESPDIEDIETKEPETKEVQEFTETLKTVQLKKSEVRDDIAAMFSESEEPVTEKAQVEEPDEEVAGDIKAEEPEKEIETKKPKKEKTILVNVEPEISGQVEEKEEVAADTEPTEFQEYLDQAWDLFVRNSYSKAFEYAEKAKELCRDSGEEADCVLLMGKISISLSHFDDAIELLKEASEMQQINDPVLKDVYLQLALAYRKKDMSDEARKYYKKILDKWGSDLEAESQLQKLESEVKSSSSSIDDSRISYV